MKYIIISVHVAVAFTSLLLMQSPGSLCKEEEGRNHHHDLAEEYLYSIGKGTTKDKSQDNPNTLSPAASTESLPSSDANHGFRHGNCKPTPGGGAFYDRKGDDEKSAKGSGIIEALEVCNGVGECTTDNACKCESGFYGENCEISGLSAKVISDLGISPEVAIAITISSCFVVCYFVLNYFEELMDLFDYCCCCFGKKRSESKRDKPSHLLMMEMAPTGYRRVRNVEEGEEEDDVDDDVERDNGRHNDEFDDDFDDNNDASSATRQNNDNGNSDKDNDDNDYNQDNSYDNNDDWFYVDKQDQIDKIKGGVIS